MIQESELRDKIYEIAKKEIGYFESPPNSNKTKYGEWFGLNGLPWCAIFVSWVFDKAGFILPKIGFEKPGFASCQMAVNYYRNKQCIVKVPTRGDIVFYDFDDNNRYDHVGIYGDDEIYGHIIAIEGNTSVKSDRNGGKVLERVRNEKIHMTFINPYKLVIN